MTNFLELKICPTTFSYLDTKNLNSLISLSLSIYTLNILTYSKSFLCTLLLCSIEKKGVKDTDIGHLWLSNTYIRDFFIKSASNKVTNTNNTYAKDAYTGATSDKNICVRSFYAIEHSQIYLQFIQNLEIKDARFEIWVRRGNTCINYNLVSQNLELKDTELEMWEETNCTCVETTCIT